MKPYFAFQWHITDTYDQRCKHCYIFAEDTCKKLTEMPWEKMQKVVASCEEMCEKIGRTPYFYITGGDTILHQDFWKLAELLKEKQICWAILGNPFHLNDAVCQKLYAYSCLKYQLSLDGMRKTHDQFRKSGSFDTTLEKIDYIKNARMYCAIMSTVSSTNIAKFPQLIDLCAEKNVDVFVFGRYCLTSGQKSEEYHIPPKQYRDFMDRCYQKFAEHQNENMIYDGCHCGIGHITILPTGDVYACRRMESNIGNVFDTPMYDLFVGNNLKAYRQFDRFEKCSKCELRGYCRGCPAVTFGYTGNLYAPDPQCWKEYNEKTGEKLC